MNKNKRSKNLKVMHKKIGQIKVMIRDLQNNKVVSEQKRVGGSTIQNLGEEIKFQRARLKELQAAQKKSYTKIVTRIRELENTLSQAELNCKYGISRGLPIETIETLSKIELLELVIEEHNKHPGGWENNGIQ